MSELLDALESREFIDAFAVINGKNIPVKVRAFNADDFEKEIKELAASKDQKFNANKIASYFFDPKTMLPAFTGEQLLSPKIKNCDIRALCELFRSCNLGLEGN